MMDFDDVLEEIGEFGRFQLRNYLLICLPVFFGAANSLSYIFTAGVPSYRCFVPGCDNDDPETRVFDSAWVIEAVPGKIDKLGFTPEFCERYVSDYNQTDHTANCSSIAFEPERETCDQWVFDSHEKTIVEEWTITCLNNQWKLSLVGTLHFLGIVLGSAVFGFLADKHGRKNVFIVSILFMSITGIAMALCQSYTAFLIWNLLNAIGTSGVYPLAFILGVELVGKSKREMSGNVLNYFYALGEAAVGLFAWLYGNWRIIQLLVSAPPLLFALYYWFVPESVRWLLIKEKNQRAGKIIRKAAKINGVELSEQLLANFEEGKMTEAVKEGGGIVTTDETSNVADSNNDGSSGNNRGNMKHAIKLALKSRLLLVRFVIIVYNWITNAFVYYGLSLNSTSLSGNKYLNYTLVCLIEIPGYTISWYLMRKCGRRWSLGCSLLVCSVTCAAGGFISSVAGEDLTWAVMTLFLIGKLGITISFAVLYTYTAEMMPTILRSCGVGAASTCARFGAMVAPFVPLLGTYVKSLPLLLFAVVSLIGGVTAFLLPETAQRKLPDTIEEAEALSKNTRQ